MQYPCFSVGLWARGDYHASSPHDTRRESLGPQDRAHTTLADAAITVSSRVPKALIRGGPPLCSNEGGWPRSVSYGVWPAQATHYSPHVAGVHGHTLLLIAPVTDSAAGMGRLRDSNHRHGSRGCVRGGPVPRSPITIRQ